MCWPHNTSWKIAVLPLDYRAAVTEVRTILTQYAKDAKGRFDLAPVFVLLEELGKAVARLERRIRVPALPSAMAELANLCLMSLGRQLIPINYCRSGPFEHDTTLPVPPFPGLEPMRHLGAIPATSGEARQLTVGLIRQRNKVCYHLSNALVTVHVNAGRAAQSPSEEHGQRARRIGRTSTQAVVKE